MTITEERKAEIELKVVDVVEDEAATDAFLNTLTEEEATYAGDFALMSVPSLPLREIAAKLS